MISVYSFPNRFQLRIVCIKVSLTVIFSKFNQRMLFLAHSERLIFRSRTRTSSMTEKICAVDTLLNALD